MASNALPIGRRVYVYRNLATGGWSLRAIDGADRGRVIAHADRLALTDAVAKVSEATRQRILGTRGRRDVYAGIVGTVCAPLDAPAGERISCNPYRAPGFYRSADLSEWTSATFVHFDLNGAAYARKD